MNAAPAPRGDQWVHPLGTAERDGWQVVIDDTVEGWQHTGLLVTALEAGDRKVVTTGDREAIVVPLAGAIRVRGTDAGGTVAVAELVGRASVFAGPTDVAYVPRGSELVLEAAADCRVAVCFAVVADRESLSTLPFRHITSGEVPVEMRGAGQASREVRNFGVPGVLDAEALIACEVVTPAGNWSSYPPHKHDVYREGVETELEEIYYFEVGVEAGAPAGSETPDPVAYQRVYGSGEREIDVLAEVRSGDVVLVPYGWHGPATAPPGYDLYYLNVMAGPGPERAWLICDDPAHAWVRQTWATQQVDPRLPLGGTR
ncbi:MAG: 5-deoxy-glucuronate isomerase [Lapillicoccus sp.]